MHLCALKVWMEVERAQNRQKNTAAEAMFWQIDKPYIQIRGRDEQKEIY